MAPEEMCERAAGPVATLLGQTGVTISDARPLSGGAIQENWLLTLAGPEGTPRAVVLRRNAQSQIAASAGRDREYAMLCAAHGVGVKVPQPLGLWTQAEPLGGPFFLMAAVDGIALGTKLVKDDRIGGDRTRLLRDLAGELARIHTIAPEAAGLTAPDGVAKSLDTVIATLRADHDALDRPSLPLELAMAFVATHSAPDLATTVIHRDFRTGNFIVDDQGLKAILDWEFSGIGDPHEDLAWLCCRSWRFSRPDREAGGLGPREVFLTAYEEASGRTVNRHRVKIWELVASIRWGVIALQQGARFTVGGERDVELPLIGRRVAECETEALRLIQELSGGDRS